MSVTTIVVPCFNEGRRLDLQKFGSFLRDVQDVDFLVVDDGSRDNTVELIRQLQSQYPRRVRLHQLLQNAGKAEAVRQGCVAAMAEQTDYVGFWDADLATPLEEIIRFVAILDRKPAIDCVIAARVPLLGHQIERRFFRAWLGRLFARAASLAIGFPVYDTQCGAKLFRATDALRVVMDTRFLSRWIFDVEILARMATVMASSNPQGIRGAIYEMPLDRWSEVAGSKLRSRDFLIAILELTRIFVSHRWSRPWTGKIPDGTPPKGKLNHTLKTEPIVAD